VTLDGYDKNPILLRERTNTWEAGSVLNPSVIYDEGVYRMVYRATNDTEIDVPGLYMSSIGYAESADGIHFTRSKRPLISPTEEYEKRLGCEDPRVTKLGDTYFLYYTAVGEDENGPLRAKARVALATSTDFRTWTKHGIVGPRHTRSKAACLFPEKIQDEYVMLYTWMSDSPLSSIMEARFQKLQDVLNPSPSLMAENIAHYEENVVFQPPERVYRGPEVGAVPIRTESGWLLIYCGANTASYPEWTISAALLDLEDPRRVLAKTKQPILKPETEKEVKGVVGNVTFPEGAVVVGEKLFVYYGSGDQGICLGTCKISDLMDYLTSNPAGLS
jgi:beta-1,2-mannobiose phosphorylase / 1,2-beta-oligomannan phosphorylase